MPRAAAGVIQGRHSIVYRCHKGAPATPGKDDLCANHVVEC